jgi:hypothetical protein
MLLHGSQAATPQRLDDTSRRTGDPRDFVHRAVGQDCTPFQAVPV